MNNGQVLISILGLTATGKSQLAFKLADKLLVDSKFKGVDVISVDSRQIYRGMAIVSGLGQLSDYGKIKAAAGLNYPFYSLGKINTHGIAIINPDQEWSLKHFRDMALDALKYSWRKHRLPILVGGTGLYHRHLFSSQLSSQVGPVAYIRERGEKLTLEQVQLWLKNINLPAWQGLNDSDKNNKRRLIRKIETTGEDGLQAELPVWSRTGLEHIRHFKIGLSDDLNKLKGKIKARVEVRLEQGVIEEVKTLLEKFPQPAPAVKSALSTLGVSEVAGLIAGKLTRAECVELWTQQELAYAKRQLTWFKKEPEMTWFKTDDGSKQIIKQLLLLLAESV